MKRFAILYVRLFLATLQARLQYRASFVLEVTIAFVGNLTGFISIWILLEHFEAIGGWAIWDIAFLYGLSTISLGGAQLLFGGIDKFGQQIRDGRLDQLLVRPAPPLFLLVTGNFNVQRIGRFSEGIFIVGIAFLNSQSIHWSFDKSLLFLFSIIGGILFFCGMMLITATLSFWTVGVDTTASTIVSYGAAHLTRYPIHIYGRAMRTFAFYILPIAFINYIPLIYLLNLPSSINVTAPLAFFSPFIASMPFALALLFWQWGLKHYQSTGT